MLRILRLAAFGLFLLPAALWPIGIALKSGEYFVADLVEDQIDAFLVRYEGRLYLIPVGEIARVQMNKREPDTIVRLKRTDGTVLEGPLVDLRGDVLTIRTPDGESEVKQDEIAERSERRETMLPPPERLVYRAPADRPVGPRDASIGVFAYGGGNLGEFRDTHSSIGGAGLFWEPAFAAFAPGGLGLRLDYLAFPNRLPIEVGSAFLMLYFYFPEYSLYFDFGAGGSLIRYVRSRTQESGPAASLGLGWRGRGERFYLKAGLRGQYARSRYGNVAHAGVEFAAVLRY